MKKFLIMTVCLGVVLLCFASCSTEISYEAAPHRYMYETSIDPAQASEITYKLNGQTYTLSYSRTEQPEYWGAGLACYSMHDGENRLDVKLDTATGDTVFFSSSGFGIGTASDEAIGRDKALQIAKNFLRKHISDFNAFTLSDEMYHKSGDYTFFFTRYIGDVPTSEGARVRVEPNGLITFYMLENIGLMRNVRILNSVNMETAGEVLQAKLDEVYREEKETVFSVDFEIEQPTLVRASDGRYALEYYVFEHITYTEGGVTAIADGLPFLVYLQ